jgi:hypothetical protein
MIFVNFTCFLCSIRCVRYQYEIHHSLLLVPITVPVCLTQYIHIKYSNTMRLSAIVILASCSSAAAFSPVSTPSRSSTQLQAENSSRRGAMGVIGASLGAALLFPQSSNANINPASETFKGRPQGKGQFIPGKGLHSHEEFNGLMANINPASENFKGRPKGKGQFIPGSCSVIVFCCYVDDE